MSVEVWQLITTQSIFQGLYVKENDNDNEDQDKDKDDDLQGPQHGNKIQIT